MKKLFWAVSAVGIIASALMMAVQPVIAQGGILIKGTSVTSVYFLGNDGKRYVFPNDKAYLSWYSDFSGITVVSDQDLASFPIGGNVTYRPGKKLVKIQTDPKTYAVDKGGVLRWVTTEAVAAQIYGSNWNQQIDDVPDIFFANYTIGAPIVSASDYSASVALASAASISDDLSSSSSVNSQPPPTSSNNCDQDIWNCGSWNSCSDSGTQSRTCELAYDCPNVSTPSPVLTQSCTQPAACTADTWSCGAWGACSSADNQTRNCTLTFDCPNVSTPSPALIQSCTPPTSCTADTWSCTSWSACAASGTQNRTCTLQYDCPSVSTPKPPETQTCTVQPALSITFNGPDTTNVVAKSDHVLLFNFTMAAQSNLEVKNLHIQLNGDGVNALDDGSGNSRLTNIQVVDTATGAVVMGPEDANQGTGYVAGNKVSYLDYNDSFDLSAGTSRTFTVTANIASTTTLGALASVKVTLNPFVSGDIRNLDSSTNIDPTQIVPSSAIAGNIMMIQGTRPTVSLVALPSTTLVAGQNVVLRFTVSADAWGNVSLKGLTALVSNGMATGIITNINPGDSSVRRVGDSSNLVGTSSLTACTPGSTCTLTMLFGNEEVVAAGTTRYYEVRLSIPAATIGDSISAQLIGDSTLATGGLTAGDATHALTVGGVLAHFVWSDNSAAAHSDTVGSSSTDWANGTYVTGIPTDTQTLSK